MALHYTQPLDRKALELMAEAMSHTTHAVQRRIEHAEPGTEIYFVSRVNGQQHFTGYKRDESGAQLITHVPIEPANVGTIASFLVEREQAILMLQNGEDHGLFDGRYGRAFGLQQIGKRDFRVVPNTHITR